MKPHAYLIEFDDHCHWGPGTWVDMDVLADGEATPCGVLTVGWVVQETDAAVVVCQSITEANDMTGAFVVARSCIRRMDRLVPAGLSSGSSPSRRGWRSLLPFGGEDGD